MSKNNFQEFYQSFLLDTLGLGPKNLVGVDIGVSSVKLCELAKIKDEFKLTHFDLVHLNEGVFHEDEIQREDEIIEVVKGSIKSNAPKSKFVCLGLWGSGVISKRIQVPVGTLEEIEDQVLWESEQYIPFDVDESKISFHIIGENVGGGADVLIAAAKNEVVESYKSPIEKAGLSVKIADLNSFALANCFSYVLESELKGTGYISLLLEFGSNSSNVLVFKGADLTFTRELNIGGSLITDQIQKSMGLSFEEAEDLKINGDSAGNLPEEILDVISASLNGFISELKKTINFYMTATGEDSFKNCYLTGGSSLLPGLLETIESEFGIETLYFNPFERIDFDSKKFSEDELTQIASVGVAALGLGMRSLEK